MLLFHLLEAFCLVAGAAVAGTLQLAAIRRERPSEAAPGLEPFSEVGRRIDRVNKPFTAPCVISLQSGDTVINMSALAIDLRRTAGYIVADRQGRLVGKVECPMYGTAPDVPDALSVKSGLFSRRRRMVPADTIDQIDGSSGVIGLRVDRESIRSFL